MEPVTELLSVQDVANRLNVSKSTVFKWTRNGEFESVKVKGRRLISPSSVKAFVDRSVNYPASTEPGRPSKPPRGWAPNDAKLIVQGVDVARQEPAVDMMQSDE